MHIFALLSVFLVGHEEILFPSCGEGREGGDCKKNTGKGRFEQKLKRREREGGRERRERESERKKKEERRKKKEKGFLSRCVVVGGEVRRVCVVCVCTEIS